MITKPPRNALLLQRLTTITLTILLISALTLLSLVLSDIDCRLSGGRLITSTTGTHCVTTQP